MGKKAIIFHGTGCRPTDFWYPWLAHQLEIKGYSVEVPYYPEINRVPIAKLLPKVLRGHRFDEETVLVGHSAGSPLILSILENVEVEISQAILVAGYVQELPENGAAPKSPFIQEVYNWEKIKQHVKDIMFINSVNDPWGCDDREGWYMFNKLGGALIIRNDGHFGSGIHKQPYPEFPLLNELIGVGVT